MTEKEFYALCDLVEKCDCDKKTLTILKKFIKLYGEEIWLKYN